MKKKFVEPQMKRIELNLTENIAASGYVYYKVMSGTIMDCILFDTGDYFMNLYMAGRQDLIDTCKLYVITGESRSRSIGLIPESEVLKYL